MIQIEHSINTYTWGFFSLACKFHSFQPYQLLFLPLPIPSDPFLHMAHPAIDISVRVLLLFLQTLTTHFLTLPHNWLHSFLSGASPHSQCIYYSSFSSRLATFQVLLPSATSPPAHSAEPKLVALYLLPPVPKLLTCSPFLMLESTLPKACLLVCGGISMG